MSTRANRAKITTKPEAPCVCPQSDLVHSRRHHCRGHQSRLAMVQQHRAAPQLVQRNVDEDSEKVNIATGRDDGSEGREHDEDGESLKEDD